MNRYCPYCGNPLLPNSRFCQKCGKQLVSAVQPAAPAARTQPAQNPVPPKHLTTPVQSPVKPGPASVQAKGSPSAPRLTVPTAARPAAPAARTQPAQNPVPPKQLTTPVQTPVKPGPASVQAKGFPSAPRLTVPTAAQGAANPASVLRFSAGGAAGEMDLGSVEAILQNSAVSEVLSPVRAIMESIGSLASGVFKLFVSPKALLFSILLTVLWFFLAMFRYSDSGVMRFLSWLTFAEGGYDRSPLGMLGGIFGRGCVGVFLSSLFSGGIAGIFKGFGGLFPKNGEKGSLMRFGIGLLSGFVCALVFTGLSSAGPVLSMGPLAGAFLSLEALGSQSGRLYELASSLASSSVSGKRVKEPGKTRSFLSGMAAGFLAAAVLIMGL